MNAITFNESGETTYKQNGVTIWAGAPNTIQWKEGYTQEGSRIRMTGVQQVNNVTLQVPYYGVLTPDGNTLLVDSYDFSLSRLTSSFSSTDVYGPKGVTPSLLRQ